MVMKERFIRAKELSERLQVKEVTLRMWAKEGKYGFPKPIKIGGRAQAWMESEIEAWLEASKEGGAEG
jgi:prophage regulatory protein